MCVVRAISGAVQIVLRKVDGTFGYLSDPSESLKLRIVGYTRIHTDKTLAAFIFKLFKVSMG